MYIYYGYGKGKGWSLHGNATANVYLMFFWR